MGSFYIQPTPRTATLTVAASNSNDARFADYVCSGTNDDVQIQAAINALPSTGGKVVLLDGTFTLGSAVLISKNNVSIKGCGKSTLVTLANAKNVPLFELGDALGALKNCTIQDIKFDGNGANQTTAGAIIDNGNIQTFGIQSLFVQGCYFINAFDGAVIDFGSYGQVVDCIFGDNGGATNGIVSTPNFIKNNVTLTTATTQTFSFSTNVIDNYFNIQGSYNATFISNNNQGVVANNSFFLLGTPGTSFIAIAIGNGSAEGNYISMNDVANTIGIKSTNGFASIIGNTILSAGIAISIDTAGNDAFTIISGNNIQGTQEDGIVINRSGYVTISNNSIQNPGQATNNTYSGIFLTDNGALFTTHCIVNGNVIKSAAVNKPKYCIRENSASDNSNIVTSNQALTAATTQISLQGAQSLNVNNITA